MIKNKFYQRDILSANQFTRTDIENIFRVASEMEKIVGLHGHADILKGKVMTALFYEPSSRTFSSFVTAIQRLGGGFIPIHGVTNTSDTIKAFSKYADIIVMRNPQVGAAKIAARFSDRPVINAGDGIGEHPTQGLLDIFTIYKRHKKIDGLTITMVGDMKNGRTIHSLSQFLSQFNRITIRFVSPKELQPQKELINKLKKNNVKISFHTDLTNILSDSDVLYVTRVQKERFKDLKLYERLKHRYVITPKELKKMKKTAIILHPLPRVGEISASVDSDPRAVYLKEEMKNGLFVRMALLALVLRKEDITNFFTDDLFLTLNSKAIHSDPIYTYKLFKKELGSADSYFLAKSLGPESFHFSTNNMRFSEFKKMYLKMLFSPMLSEDKSTLIINEKNFRLKHGESGRNTTNIYLNHRVPLFNDLWDKKLLVKLLEMFIHKNILSHGSIYGIVAISSSSSPEITAAMHENSPHSTLRAVMLPRNLINKEKGTHEPIYGNIDVNLPWIFIDDVFTSGETLGENHDLFKKNISKKADVATYGVTLVNRNPKITDKFMSTTNMKIFSLVTLDDILKYHWKHFSTLQKKLINKERHL